MKGIAFLMAALLLPAMWYMPYLSNALLTAGAIQQEIAGMLALSGLPLSLTGGALILFGLFWK